MHPLSQRLNIKYMSIVVQKQHANLNIAKQRFELQISINQVLVKVNTKKDIIVSWCDTQIYHSYN